MANQEDIAQFFTPAMITAEQNKGREIRDNPQSVLPPLAGWGQQATPELRDSVISALMGLNKSMEASQSASRFGDPFTAALASISGAAAQPGPQAIANQRAEAQRQAALNALASAPIEMVSPAVVQAHPELKGLPLSVIHQIAPILERDAATREAQLSIPEIKALGKVQRGESLTEQDLVGVRKGIISETSLASQADKKETAKGLAQQLINGDIPPSFARGRGTVGLEALNIAKKLNPGYNPTKAELDYQTREASAKLTGGGSSQVVARAANSASEQLDILQRASDAFPRSDTRLMNTAIIKLAEQGNPEAAKFMVAVNSARFEYATALNRGAAPTRETLEEAKRAIPDTITPRQLPAIIDTMRENLAATVKGQMNAAGPAAPTGSTVQMMTPDGKVWSIPADKVAAAEKRGARRL